MLAQFCKSMVAPLESLIHMHQKAVGFLAIFANVGGF
jgi:hypothetical protein